MRDKRNGLEITKAWKIGGACIAIYFFTYVLRNVLSVATPNMIKEAFFTKEYIGLLSSTYFICYAVGQFINGFVSERLHPKYTLTVGSEMSCLCLFIVPLVENRIVHMLCFAMIGFCLSMLRGTLTKIVAENVWMEYASMICAGLSAVCYVSPFAASVLSIFFSWRMVFRVAAILGAVSSAMSIILLLIFEKKKLITFVPADKKVFGTFKDIFRLKDYVIHLFISASAEIIGTAVNFWLPTYMTEYLEMPPETAYTIYSVSAFTGLFAPFITLLIYRTLIHDGIKISAMMFGIATLAFAIMLFTKNPYISSAVLLVAMLSAACAAGAVWTIYIPRLSESGMVASANGVLDATGYGMVSVANLIFSSSMSFIGWNGLVAMWGTIMLVVSVVVAGYSRRNHA